jgi:DNA repair protein RecO (recombination protein O)
MSLIETESLVLRTYNLAEADRIVVFLTHDHGVIRSVAKGAKRLKSRFGGGLEPFTVGRLTYFQKEGVELSSIRQLDLIESYFAAAAQPAFLQKFSYLSELLLAITPPHDPNKDLYRMFKACLETAAEQSDSLESIGLYFELWLLRLGGYLPDWTRCNVCKTSFDEGVETYLQSTFQLICGNCRRASGQPGVSPMHRNIFFAAQKLSPSNFVDFAEPYQTEVLALSGILRRVISLAIGRDVTVERSLAMSNAE